MPEAYISNDSSYFKFLRCCVLWTGTGYPKYKIMTIEEYAHCNAGCLWGEGKVKWGEQGGKVYIVMVFPLRNLKGWVRYAKLLNIWIQGKIYILLVYLRHFMI